MEPQIIAVLDIQAPIGKQEKIRARHNPSRRTECKSSDRSTQCFNCSRIYFDQSLTRCPHCKSDSLQHYTTADLTHFARTGDR